MIRPDTVDIVDQPQQAAAPHIRLSVATMLGLTSIAGSILLISADGVGGSVRWTHHAAVSAAPLLLVAGAIAAVSVAHPLKARQGLMRLVAVLAFTAWGIAQLFPNSAAAGTLNDVAILLFVIDAGCAVVADARPLRRAYRPPAGAAGRAPDRADTWHEVQQPSHSRDIHSPQP